MISTVTVTTISTITSVTTTAAVGMVAVFSIAATLALFVFLSARELVSIRSDGQSQRIRRFLGVGIIPLLMAFVSALIFSVVQFVN